MKGERWEKAIAKVERPDDWGIQVISSSDVRALLRRQHAAVVRMVKKLDTFNGMDVWISKYKLLAALAKQKGGKNVRNRTRNSQSAI